MTTETVEEWAQAYIRIQNEDGVNTEHADWWAVERFISILLDESSSKHLNCWAAILKILQITDDEDVLGLLAAGPLEDLIDTFGELYIDQIVEEARVKPKFRWLLGGVWESGTKEVWGKIVKVRVEAC